MTSPVEEIKSRLDIVEFIQSYIRLQKAGINFKALCPFHSEKTPSFFVSPTRQIWHCFGGCGKGGDIFKFVMEIEGCDFPEALRLLAQRAGVTLKREDPAIRSERNRLYDLCEEAAKVFERSLALTPAAKTYLIKRGVTDKTIQEFRIGFAPQNWDFLLKALRAKGFRDEEVEKAGLAVRSEDTSSRYDRFRSRIVFPITDTNGRTVGFSGRIFEPEAGSQKQEAAKIEAKYVNTPSTLLYDKSRVLYGFDKAKNEIRSKNQVVVVEGQMDCIMSHQAGITHTIAVSGTALTPQQLKTLRRLCDTIVSSFDTDAAGESATRRSLALAAEFEFERKVALIPSGKDPADTIKENPTRWQEAVVHAKNVVEFYFEKTFREKNAASLEGKKEVVAILKPFLAEIQNEIEKAHWVGELSKKLGMPEETVWKELKRKSASLGARFAEERGADSSHAPLRRRELLEERFLTLLVLMEEELQQHSFENRHLIFISSLHRELFETLRGGGANAAPHLASAMEMLKFKGEVLRADLKDYKEEFSLCEKELEKECVKEKLLQLEGEIAKHEREGSHATVISLLQDFRTFSEKLKSLT